jgi:hypothetical protein
MPEERLFNSCKVLSRHIRIGQATCSRTLHDKSDLKTFHLRSVPRALSTNQKSETASYSQLLLTALMGQKASGFQRIVTRDEPWFFFYYPRDLIWAVFCDEVSQHIKQKNQHEECLVSILWSVS